MTERTGDARHWNHWRMAGWAMAVALLLLPLVAMQFTDEVNWDVFDFVVFGSMLLGAGVICEITVGMTSSIAYRSAVGVALVAGFLLVWVNLAVGIIGSEDNPANLIYGGVLAIAIIGAAMGRFRPAGMARALSVTALAQALAGIIALVGGFGSMAPGAPQAVVFSTGLFAVLWLVSAYLFLKAQKLNRGRSSNCRQAAAARSRAARACPHADNGGQGQGDRSRAAQC